MGVMWIVLFALLSVAVGVMFVRAAAFKPKKESAAEPEAEAVDGAAAVEHLRRMVRCRTVSFADRALQDESEFRRFRELLTELYPELAARCRRELVGGCGLLFRWKGKSDGRPAVLMSHYDVVPADERDWDVPAFDGVLKDGFVWGRGTLDTKTTLLGVMEAAESLIKEGFQPENDVYFAFSGNEEVFGDGAPGIVDLLEKRGITPSLVVDEGGAVVRGVFPGVSAASALVGVGEKGVMDVVFTAESAGGHASAPPREGPLGILAAAVVELQGRRFPMRISAPVAAMFDTLGRHSTFGVRFIFANLWFFAPLLGVIAAKSLEMNALLRTTCAFTQAEASNASNVLPTSARVVANLRLAAGDNSEAALRRMRGIVRDERVSIRKEHCTEPSPVSDIRSRGYKKLRTAILQTWPGTVVSPYLMIAASDSRHFCRISDCVYRFSAMELSSDERGLLHAGNERIPAEKVVRTVEFYRRLIKQC